MGRVQTSGAVRRGQEGGLEGGAEARKDSAHVGSKQWPLTSGVGWGWGVRRNGLLRCSLLETGSCGRLVDSHGVTIVLFRREHCQQQGGLCSSRF